MRLCVLLLLLRELDGRALPNASPGTLLVVDDPLIGCRVVGLWGDGLLVVLPGLDAAALVLGGGQVVNGVGVGGLRVTNDVEPGGVGGVAEAVEGVVLLVEEEREERGVLDVAELVVPIAGGG